jgi:hypothetical protein
VVVKEHLTVSAAGAPLVPRPKLPTATIVDRSLAPDARAWPSATSSAHGPPVKW